MKEAMATGEEAYEKAGAEEYSDATIWGSKEFCGVDFKIHQQANKDA